MTTHLHEKAHYYQKIAQKITEHFPLSSINIDQLASTVTKTEEAITNLFKCDSHKHLELNLKKLGLTRGPTIGTVTDADELKNIICKEIGAHALKLIVCGNKSLEIIPMIFDITDNIGDIACVGLVFNEKKYDVLRLEKINIEQQPASQNLSLPQKQPTDIETHIKATKCRCGENKPDDFEACANTKRYKSRCPCVHQNKACTIKCRCKNCKNEHGTRNYPPHPVKQTIKKRKPRHMTIRKNPVKRGLDYVKNNCVSEKGGKWTDIELCIFYTVYRNEDIKEHMKDLIYLLIQNFCNEKCNLGLTRQDKHLKAKKQHATNRAHTL